MLKSASVQLVGKEKIARALRNDHDSLATSPPCKPPLLTGKQTVERLGGKLIMADVIPRPHADLAALLPK